MSASRPTLTLSKQGIEQSEDEKSVEVAVFDVLLPGRFFSVTHKVAELGRVSMTTEYLLRLLRSVDGMEEEQVREFFGFDRREMGFVLAEVETNGYVNREDGRLWLTTTGRGLFRDGSEEPQVFEVEKRTDRIAIDLFSLAPLEREFLTSFETSLPELHPTDPSELADVTKKVPAAFRYHYSELVSRRDKEAPKKRALYSVDDVSPGDRFSSCVRVIARSSVARPDFPEPDLSAWKPEAELDDRAMVVNSVARFLNGLAGQLASHDSNAYDVLLELAPEFLADFRRKDGLAVDRFYREAVERVGEFRIDRPTVPLVGSVFTRANFERLGVAFDYAIKADSPLPSACLWVVPNICWGTTRVLTATLDLIRRRIGEGARDEEGDVAAIAIARKRDRHLTEAFTYVDTAVRGMQESLEMLLVPGLLVAAVVHAPIRVPTAFPVPLGVMSFDAAVVQRAEGFLRKRLPTTHEVDSSPDYSRILAPRTS
jgi:hypothetical protein